MKRGRKPKSTALRIFEGNPSRRDINTDEPFVDAPLVKPSIVGIDQHASAKWDELIESMPSGIYQRLDTQVLASHCLAWSQFCRSTIDIDEVGLWIDVKQLNQRTGEFVLVDRKTNPSVRTWRAAVDVMIKTGDRLGLSPGARANLKTTDRTKSIAGSRFGHLLKG